MIAFRKHLFLLKSDSAPPEQSGPDAAPDVTPDQNPAAAADLDLTRLSERAAGTRAAGVVDDLLRYARAEVESFTRAAEALSAVQPEPHREAMLGLTRARIDTIRAELDRAVRLSLVMEALEAKRAELREARRDAQVARDAAGRRPLPGLIAKHDELASQIAETERRRAEAIGEIARSSLRASYSAKALYAQISVLSGREKDTVWSKT